MMFHCESGWLMNEKQFCNVWFLTCWLQLLLKMTAAVVYDSKRYCDEQVVTPHSEHVIKINDQLIVKLCGDKLL